MHGHNCERCSNGVTSCASAAAETEPRQSQTTSEKKFCNCWRVCADENPTTPQLAYSITNQWFSVDGRTGGPIRHSQSGIRGERFQSRNPRLRGTCSFRTGHAKSLLQFGECLLPAERFRPRNSQLRTCAGAGTASSGSGRQSADRARRSARARIDSKQVGTLLDLRELESVRDPCCRRFLVRHFCDRRFDFHSTSQRDCIVDLVVVGPRACDWRRLRTGSWKKWP